MYRSDRSMTAGSGPYSVMCHSEFTESGYMVRAVEPEHIEAIRQWRNAQTNILRQSRQISPDEQQTYFAKNIWPEKHSESPTNILLILLENNVPIGYGGLVHINWDYKRAEISFLLDPSICRPEKNVADLFSLWLRLMKRVGFSDLGLKRLTTETYVVRSLYIRVLEQEGFQREGRLRKHVHINGQPVDSLVHGCLAEDFSCEDSNQT